MHAAKLKKPIRTASGVAFAAGAAAAVILIAPPHQSWVPLFFIIVLLAIARTFGMAAGVIGSLVSAAVFATWMYMPIGSFVVRDLNARENLAWMVMTAISVSFLLLPPAGKDSGRR